MPQEAGRERQHADLRLHGRGRGVCSEHLLGAVAHARDRVRRRAGEHVP